jgi:hypothetical protein
MALILALTRRLFDMDRCTRIVDWHARVRVPVRRLAGQAFGLVGFGKFLKLWHAGRLASIYGSWPINPVLTQQLLSGFKHI